MKKIIFLFCLLLSCGSVKEKSLPVPLPELISKVSLYKKKQPPRLDKYGYAHDKCDSVLFTSICKIAGGCKSADIYASESKTEPGRWYRNPDQDCYPDGSASDISKDMFIGITFYLLHKNDKEAFGRIAKYGRANNWVMGKGPFDRTLLLPPLLWVITGEEIEQASFPFLNKDYRAHLDILWILIKAKRDGSKISQYDLEYLKAQAARSPNNALFQAAYHKYADGDQSAASAILMREDLFPQDDLPTSKNYCTEYLWQRDENYNWLPCDDGGKHDGVDFLFAAWVAYGEL